MDDSDYTFMDDKYTRMIFDHETLWRCEKCLALLEIKKFASMNSNPKVQQISDPNAVRFCPCCGRTIKSRVYHIKPEVRKL